MPEFPFHPVIESWFKRRFGEPTEPQRRGWPAVAAGRHTLIAAPTGSGKTLAAFLACIDDLLRQGLEGRLVGGVQAVYVSPLKALSNDIRRNLELPLQEIQSAAIEAGRLTPPIRAAVRTGDTPASERQAMLKDPPHILVTTPESLYLLLTSEKSRRILGSVRTVIVDEIHALARDKRGSHLALSLERLERLCAAPPVRIGLSATQKPLEDIARFLVGTRRLDAAGAPDCHIVDGGHARALDLGLELPPSDLSAVCSKEQWDEVYARLTELIVAHRSTLVFVNTRRLAERVTHHLTERLGQEAVASHHGSLAKEIRLSAEERLKAGKLKAIVATASLEMGIDIGFIDLVCQIGSPRAIATFLQRVGRSGHSLGLTPKGRIFPLSRDELMETLALLRAVRRGRLDAVEIPAAPLDILAQQVVAAAACEEWDEDALFELCRGAWPYRDLSRRDFDRILSMASEGAARGRKNGAYLHRDALHRKVKARRAARLTALTSGGAIPETADYRVVTEGERSFVGTVNEDFAIESLSGDVFLLGNTSWRISHVRGGEVVVRDAGGAPATIPFWLGEAPGRTAELSAEVAELRQELDGRIPPSGDVRSAADWLRAECGADGSAARQAAAYAAAQKAAVGFLPTQKRLLFERFFDDSGGMQLIVHAPFGSRVNRAWGLAMRKRFCRTFDFELQASADDNGIALALGPQHSFPLDSMFKLVPRRAARDILVQALLAAPMFQVRWRWNATRALAVLRMRGGKKVPPPLQRFQSDDLLAAVFPQQTACAENRPGGDVAVPDHPLVAQTVFDCLHEAMDVDRWEALLEEIEAGRIALESRDTREPSPFSYEILNANVYSFLDDAPLEERRARALSTRRALPLEELRDLAALDPAAVARVRAEAWPLVRDAEELHDALLAVGALPASEGAAWTAWFDELAGSGRATAASLPDGKVLWAAAENAPLLRAAYPEARLDPAPDLPPELRKEWTSAEAVAALVRGRLDVSGPVTAEDAARDLCLRVEAVRASLEALEGEGFALRGNFTAGAGSPVLLSQSSKDGRQARGLTAPPEWCERRLLARIHRLSLEGARRRIQPVSPADFWRFLLEHQGAAPSARREGRSGAFDVVQQLQGLEIPAGAWETDVLPARLKEYDSRWLDDLSFSGDLVWGRLQPPRRSEDDGPSGSGLTRVVPIALAARTDLPWLLPPQRSDAEVHARTPARQALDALRREGALFFNDLVSLTGLLPSQLEDALSELAALGLVTADGFAAIRGLSAERRWSRDSRRRSRWTSSRSYGRGGRWTLFPGRALGGPVLPADENRDRDETAPQKGEFSAALPAELQGQAADQRSDSPAAPSTKLQGQVAPQRGEFSTDRAVRWARQLLRRYGVMFRDLLARESAAPAWWELAAVYRRLEARGEIHGGRFVSGVAGEQYALPECVEALRRARDAGDDGRWTVISAADPLNLLGVLAPGARVPAVRGNRILFRGARPAAALQGGETQFWEDFPPAAKEKIARALKLTGAPLLRDELLSSLAAELPAANP